MQVIIKQTLQEFEDINERIHAALMANIPGYSGSKWSEPIVNKTTNEYACIVETEGLRGAIILAYVLTETEKTSIISISIEDENWFQRMKIEQQEEIL